MEKFKIDTKYKPPLKMDASSPNRTAILSMRKGDSIGNLTMSRVKSFHVAAKRLGIAIISRVDKENPGKKRIWLK